LRATASGLKITPRFLDLLSELFPPVLDESPTHDLNELGLLFERQFINSV
jgi:hypothetical protein